MSNENPFDWIKDVRKSTKKVDFVAVSPKLKEFKESVEDILNPTSAVGALHAIIGDYGTGKSHINHYLYDRAKERDDILVSYVSCKDVIDRVEEEKEKDLFGVLLNALIHNLQDNAPTEIKNIIKREHENAVGDKYIKKQRELVEKGGEDKDHHLHLLRVLMERAVLDKEKFFCILEKMKNNETYSSNISRVIFIIDEFEIFDRDHHYKSLEKIWAMRDNISNNPDIIWVFSCAYGSWKRLSEEKTPDMFGANSTVPHIIPPYDKDDRKEMIWSRMLSLIDGYTAEKRSGYSDPKHMAQYCFPFFDRKVEGNLLPGSDIAEMLARPDLYPRRLVANCNDFYGDYKSSIESGASKKAAFESATRELFKKHFFDLISEEKFNVTAMIIWENIASWFGKRAIKEDDFLQLFKQLFIIYLTRKSDRYNHEGFENNNVHQRVVNEMLWRVLGMRQPIERHNTKAFQLLIKIEELLRVRCLEDLHDPETDKDFLVFRIRDFQPEGALPYLSESFHRMIDKETGPSGVITREETKNLFTKLLKEERNQGFESSLYERAIQDLLEAGKLEHDTKEHKGYLILDRKEIEPENEFRNGLRTVLRKKEEIISFFRLLSDEERGFFLPPLKENEDGFWEWELRISSIHASGKLKKSIVRIYFLESLSDEDLIILGKNDFSVVFTFATERELSETGLDVEQKNVWVFSSYISKGNGAVYMFLIPSDDLIEGTDYLTWKQLLSHYESIGEIADSCGYRQEWLRFEKLLEKSIQDIPESISKLPIMRWDEADFYKFRFKGIGPTKIDDLTELLVQVLKEDKIKLSEKNRGYAEFLSETYPWLKLGEETLSKDKRKCSFKLSGKPIDELVKALSDLIEDESVPLDEIANQYIQKIERQNQIIDETSSGEKRQTYVPIRLLLNAIAKAFPNHFSIDSNKISKLKTLGIPELNDRYISWFLSIVPNTKVVNHITKILAEKEGLEPTAFLADVNTAIEIHGELSKKNKESYLLSQERSSIQGTEVKRYVFLEWTETWAKSLISILSGICWAIKQNFKKQYDEGLEAIQNVSDLVAMENLNKAIREEIEKRRQHSSLHNVIDEGQKFINRIEEIKGLIELSNPKDFDMDTWLGSIKENPGHVITILEINTELKDFQEKMGDSIRSFRESINFLIRDKKQEILTFKSFIKSNENMINMLPDGALKEEIVRIRDEIMYIPDSPADDLKGAFDDISRIQKTLDRAYELFTDLIDYWIENIFKGHKSVVERFRQLSLKYTEKPDETNSLFETLFSDMETKMCGCKENAKGALEAKRTLETWAQTEPGKMGSIYREKAKNITKECISSGYRSYLDEAMEAIENNELVQSLLNIEKKEGRDRLMDCLVFLREMERNGILSYK